MQPGKLISVKFCKTWFCTNAAVPCSEHCLKHSTFEELCAHDTYEAGRAFRQSYEYTNLMERINMSAGNCYACGKSFASENTRCFNCGAVVKMPPPDKTPREILQEVRKILGCFEDENVILRATAIMRQLKTIAEAARLVTRG